MRRILLLSVLLAAGLAVRAAARAGDGQNYSGGGGSYSPGGYSSYSSSPYSGPYRRYRPGLLDAYVLWVVTNPLQGIPVTLFLLYVVVSCLKFKHAAPPSADIVTRQPYIESEAELERLRVRDPSFDVRTFLARCDAAFLKVQEAWSAGDMAPARAFLSDGVAERFGRQLASLKKRGLRNVLTEVEIESSRLVHAFSGTHFDALSVAFTVRARDETLDGSGRRIKGSSGRLPFQEVWTFLRRPGARTLGRAGTLEGACPSCGAPVSIVDAARCETCETWVNSADHDWVLTEITQACEWAPPNHEARVAGWAEASAADPHMSVEALEDRVSVLFWRRVDPYLDDAAVGVVDLGVMERDKDWSRAHVRVRWSASGFARTEVFIMKRAASAVTDARQGLRTARCPACGAPPAIAEPAACAYCGAPADDGRRDWVLDRVVSFEAWRRPPALSAPAPVAAAAWKPLSPMAAFEAMAAVMVSDGEVSLGERAALDAFARARGLPAERTVEVLAAARAGALDVPAAENGEQAAAIIRSMARIGLADGVVNQRERGVLVAYAARYGLTPDDVSAIVQAERGAMSA